MRRVERQRVLLTREKERERYRERRSTRGMVGADEAAATAATATEGSGGNSARRGDII